MMRSLQLAGWIIVSVLAPSAQAAIAAGPRPDQIFAAEGKKTQHYVKEGLFTGGDRAMSEVIVTDIRRSPNADFERIVLDLQGNKGGNPVAIPRSPYFQVAMSQAEQRILVTVWGNPKLSFDPKKVQASFKKSSGIRQLQLLPRIEEDSWTFALDLQPGRFVEVFELANPVRIVLDIRQSRVAP